MTVVREISHAELRIFEKFILKFSPHHIKKASYRLKTKVSLN